jgi:glycosyltransferase involved in cell wall biosynthesis
VKAKDNSISDESHPDDFVVFTSFPLVCISHGFQSNYERGFCNGLAQNGVVLTLIGSDRTDTDRLASTIQVKNLRGSQEESRSLLMKLFNMVRYHLSLMTYFLYAQRSVIHVIGLIDPPLLSGLIEGLWFRLLSRRYVLTVHDLQPHDRHTMLNRVAYGLSFQLPHRLVVHTERMKHELSTKFHVDTKKITVMEHGIEPTLDESPEWGDDRKPADLPMILVFGKIEPYKGVDLLILALQSVSFSFRLVIAGACMNADFRKRLQMLISHHPFHDQIEWLDGYIEEAEMESLFKEADLLGLPYRHIDQSGVLFQALRYGVPVVATRVGQFAHYVTPEVGELAEPNDVLALTDTLERWSTRRLSLNRSRIREIGRVYGWHLTVRVLKAVYR